MTGVAEKTDAPSMPCRKLDLSGLLVAKVICLACMSKNGRNAPLEIPVNTLQVRLRVTRQGLECSPGNQGRCDLAEPERAQNDVAPRRRKHRERSVEITPHVLVLEDE